MSRCPCATTRSSAPTLAAWLLTLGAILSGSVYAQRLSYYETRSIVLSAERVATQANQSYWQSRLVQQTQLTLIQRPGAALAGLEPLFAAVSTWLQRAPTDTSDWVFVLDDRSRIGARAALRSAGERPELDLQPFEVDLVSSIQARESATEGWRPSGAFRHAGFPGGVDAYCDAHSPVCAAVFTDAKEQAHTLLTVASESSQASFLVDREATDTGPVVRYLADVGVTPLRAPDDFAQRDMADLTLEGESSQARIVIRGTESLAPRERIAVKNAIASYVQSGTRSAEADVVLPAGPAGEAMLYTLRFLPNGNEVTVESLGTAADLLPDAGPRSDVRHIPGYPTGANRAQLLEWLHKRYPALSISGKTPAEIAANTNRAVERYSTTVDWFQSNYQISVLDPKAADRRLAAIHRRAINQRGGLREFHSSELRALEAVLQRIGERGLFLLRGTAFVRQRAADDNSPFGDPGQRVQIAGHTFSLATDDPENDRRQVQSTVVIYDAAHAPHRFIGGRRPDGQLRTYAPIAQVMAHELAHVMSQRAPVQREFDALVSASGAQPFTRYAASNPESEFFPEACALYLLDPAWVKDNQPELYERVQAYLKRPRPGAL